VHLEPLVIQGESLDDVFPQPLRRPDAELRAPVRFHMVAHGDDHIQVVVLDVAGDLFVTFGLNWDR